MKTFFTALFLALAMVQPIQAATYYEPSNTTAWYFLLMGTQFVETFLSPGQHVQFDATRQRACLLMPNLTKCTGGDPTFWFNNLIVQGTLANGHHIAVISYTNGGSGGTTMQLAYDLSVQPPLMSNLFEGQGMAAPRFVNGVLVINVALSSGAFAPRVETTYNELKGRDVMQAISQRNIVPARP
jgi:hypothetical protein